MEETCSHHGPSRNLDCLSHSSMPEQTNDEVSRLRMRQAIYVHSIVELLLRERVDLLPELPSLPVEIAEAKPCDRWLGG